MSNVAQLLGIDIGLIAEINGIPIGSIDEINGATALKAPAAPINLTAVDLGDVPNLVMEGGTDNWVTESKTDNIIEE